MGKKVEDILEKFKRVSRVFDIVFVHLDSFYILSRCNPGILSIAAVLKKAGFSCKILTPVDLFCLSLEDIKNFFLASNPSIVGFYTNSDNIFSVEDMAGKVRKWLPQCRIIAGGPLASALGEGIFKIPYFDASVCGEGEFSMLGYALAVIRDEGALEKIPSLLYREGVRVHRNTRAEPIENLDELPLQDLSLTGPHPTTLSISSGRGCPFGCAFCFQAVHGRKYRYRSPENVVSEIIASLEKYNLSIFSLTDDTFVANPQRVIRFCELISDYRKRSGREVAFYCEGRVDIFWKHPELLETLKKAGLIRLQVGIESGDQRVIDAYMKGIRLEQVEALIERLSEIGGISLVGHFIVGGALETEERVEKSIRFAKQLIEKAPGIFETGVGFFCPYPGTVISREPGRFEIEVIDPDFKNNISTLEASCATRGLSIESVRILKQKFFREIDCCMRKNVKNVPHSRMSDHFHWAAKYTLTTFWYPYMKEKQALEKYFFFQGSPRFFSLQAASKKDPGAIFPLRTIAILSYDKDGRALILTESTRKFMLRDDEEIFIYKRSCGKHSLLDIAREAQSLFHPQENIENVINKKILPFYEKLEKYYYMCFYE